MLRKLIYTSLLATISFSALSIEQTEIIDLQQKASVGDTAAQLLLGQLMLTNKIEVPGDKADKGIELILRAAQAGNAKAQFTVGVLYEKGMIGSVDLEKAYIAYEDAAKNGYVKSLVNMGYIKEQQGNLIQARTLYSEAGDKGDALGYLNLHILEKREGNKKQADKALIAAAQAGNSSAQYIYASELLKLNKAQPLNDATPAILWLKVAAKQGNEDAISDLISLYDKGMFNSDDLIFIESLLNKLSSQGVAKASFMLAKYFIKEHNSYSDAWPLLSTAISNNVNGALAYKNLLLDSKPSMTIDKDIYIVSDEQANNQPPILIEQGSHINVVDEHQNGLVFVIADQEGVHGYIESKLLYADEDSVEVIDELEGVQEVEASTEPPYSAANTPVKTDSVSKIKIKNAQQTDIHTEKTNIQKVVALINRPVNFRENAHPQSKIISSLNVGDEVTFISSDDWGWAQVIHNGTNGYVMARAIDYDEK